MKIKTKMKSGMGINRIVVVKGTIKAGWLFKSRISHISEKTHIWKKVGSFKKEDLVTAVINSDIGMKL